MMKRLIAFLLQFIYAFPKLVFYLLLSHWSSLCGILKNYFDWILQYCKITFGALKRVCDTVKSISTTFLAFPVIFSLMYWTAFMKDANHSNMQNIPLCELYLESRWDQESVENRTIEVYSHIWQRIVCENIILIRNELFHFGWPCNR